jgi:hypothetical protein
VCDTETRRFNREAANLGENIEVRLKGEEGKGIKGKGRRVKWIGVKSPDEYQNNFPSSFFLLTLCCAIKGWFKSPERI